MLRKLKRALLFLLEIDVRLLRRRLSGKARAVLGVGREIPCETTATRKVHTLQELSLIDIFASDSSENRTCVAEVFARAHFCNDAPPFKLHVF